jgi:hypothetical protein
MDFPTPNHEVEAVLSIAFVGWAFLFHRSILPEAFGGSYRFSKRPVAAVQSM